MKNGRLVGVVRTAEASHDVAAAGGRPEPVGHDLEHLIARIVALGDNHASVQQGIYQGRRALETTFDTNFPEVM